MFDYYNYVNNLSEEKIIEEIEKITKRLFSISVGTPMYDQLNYMLAQAQQAYDDLAYARILKTQNKDKDGKDISVMDIGEIESETYTPVYSDTEILTAMVEAYTTGPKK